ncbi:obscurin isoform X2 [Gasterosteus aculeatus]
MLFVRLGSLTDMDVPLRVLLILAGLTGIHSIRVSEVSVKAGGSISIPCLYSSKYTNHVKYLCKGYYWNYCTYEVRTDQSNSAKFSISDDKIQKIFTVTVNKLTNDDLYYWCAVDIDGGVDDGDYFHLSVTTGTRSLYVDNQEITAFLGGNVTIKCHHQGNPGEMRWCRMGSSCVTQPSGSIDGTEVTIDTNVPSVFSVTMRGLKTESSGWYLCVSGNLQFPVRLTVTEQPTTRIHSIRVSEVSVKAGGSISIPCLYSSQYTNHVKYLCKGFYWSYCTYQVKTNQKNSAKFSKSDDEIQKIFTVTVNELTNDDSYYWCGVEDNDGPDDGYRFHLSVTTGTRSLYVDNQEKTAFLGGDVTIKCHHQRNPGEMRWCRMGSSCVTQPSGSIDGTEFTIDTNVPNVFSVTMRGLKTESSGWYLCVSGNLQFPVRLTVTEQPTTRIHSIRVSEVSVKAGGSISIPCLYSSKYTNHVKYLCKGYYLNYCTYQGRTDQSNSAKFSISDDKIQKIFTVTVNELTNDDLYYWCGVEDNDGADDGYRFHLSVTTGTRSLYVDNQEKTAFLGGAITIKCHHQHNPGEMRWCRMGSSCVTQRSGSINGTEFTIDTNVPNVFSVTMRGLKTESSGWYLCVSGNLQFPVRLTVTEQPTTRIHSIRVSEVSVKAGGSISIPCLYSSQYTNHVKYLCKGYDWNTCTYQVKTNQKNSTKFSISDDKIQKIFTVTVNELTNDDSHYWCAVEINDGADEREYFHLSVTTGTRSLYVDNQEKTAFLGGDVTIKCHHQRNPGEMRWCRMGSSCVTQRSGSIDGTEFTIDRNVPNVFSVTMRGLKTESSGWYLCVSGNLQFPVRLTVTEQPNTRIHSIRVSEVSVKAGGSISIPCLYSSQYTNHVKYLCKGYYWISCTYEVRTDQSNSAKFSISDDKIQKIFTVTVNKLTNDDLYYWCAVDIDGGVDDGDYFHLSVTTGTRSLYVDNQEKTAFLGGAITIKCHHQRNPGEMRWCRMGSSCVNQPSGSIDGTKVTIDTNVPNVFSVTMRGLKTESSGWYLCVSGNLQFPVRLTVTEQPNTRIHSIRASEVSVKAGGSISIPCLYSSQYTNHVKYLCKGYYWNYCTFAVRTDQKNSAKFSISDDKIQKIFTVTVNELTNGDSHYWCAVEINGGGDDRGYFHLSVTTGTRSLYVDNQEKTAFLGGDITIKCHHQRNPGEMRWCRMGSSCVTQRSGSIDGTEFTIDRNVPNVFSVTMRGLKTESSGWYLCVSGNLQFPVRLTVTEQPTTTPLQETTHKENLSTFLPGTTPTTVQKGQNRNASFGLTETLILTSVLIFTLMVALCFCLMLKRHKQNKSASSAMKEAEEEVTYSVVKPRRKPSSQRSYVEQDVDVTYSTVVSMRQQRVQRVEADEENVTYSTLALD